MKPRHICVCVSYLGVLGVLEVPGSQHLDSPSPPSHLKDLETQEQIHIQVLSHV